MKFIFLLSLFILSFTSYSQEVKGPIIELEQSTHDFGDIHQGDKVEKNFKITNKGTEPLIISDVVTSCGCTVTQWTKEPLMPGQSKDILATFNSAGKEGRQNKVITIISNASNSPSRISIVTNVLPVRK